MKIIYSILILAFFVPILSAQTEIQSNNLVAGGSVNFYVQQNLLPSSSVILNGGLNEIYSTSASNRKTTRLYLSPYFAKEVSTRWLLGLQLQYSFDRSTAEGIISNNLGQLDTFNLKQTENGYGVGLFGRYTFNPENRFQVYLQPAVNYSFVNEVNHRDEIVTGEAESYAFGIVTSLGVLYEISDQFSLTSRFGAIGYTTGQWTDKDSDESQNFNSFSTTLNLTSLYFGFEYRF